MEPHQADPFVASLPHRLWRGLPQTLRRRALARTTAWLVPPPVAQHGPPPAGIAIGGELTRASGLGEGARLMAAAARHLGTEVWTVDLPPPVDSRPEVAADPAEPLPARIPLVMHVNAPTLPLALLRLPRDVARRRPIIGYWAWELPSIPPEWRPALACVSEVWVPSRFTAASLETALPGRVRVVPPPLAVVPPIPSNLTRAEFGLPQDAVVVLVSFNLASSLERKNPFAAIAAFKAAFGDRPDRILVLKIGHPDHAPADFARLRQMAQAPNIRIDTRTLPSRDRHALTACADIVLSLHRAEGFGLVMAEAMLLGKAVVATGWSGNTEFMTPDTAALVRYRLVPARDSRAIYRDAFWAEVDLADAADRLRALADDPAERRALGQRARASAAAGLTARPLATALRGVGLQLPL